MKVCLGILSIMVLLCMSACAAAINGKDGLNGKDGNSGLNGTNGSNAVSLNVSGTVGPNQCIVLPHYLGRTDLTFEAQFMLDSNSGVVYDWTDYKADFSHFQNQKAYKTYAADISGIATAAFGGNNVAIAYKDVSDGNKLKYIVLRYSGYSFNSPDSILGPVTVESDAFPDLSKATNIGISVLDSGNVVVHYAMPVGSGVNLLQFSAFDTNGNKASWGTYCGTIGAGMSSAVINKFYGMNPVGKYSIVSAYNEITNGSAQLENKGKFTIFDLSSVGVPVNIAYEVVFSANPVGQVKVASLGKYFFIIAYNDLTDSKAKFSIYRQQDWSLVMATNFQNQKVSNIDIAVLPDDRFMIAFNDISMSQASYMIFNCGYSGKGELLKDKSAFLNRKAGTISLAVIGGSRFMIGYEGLCKFCDRFGNLDQQETLLVQLSQSDEFNLTSLNQEDVVVNYSYIAGAAHPGQFEISGDTCLSVRKLNDNVAEFWNRTKENLYFMFSLNQ